MKYSLIVAALALALAGCSPSAPPADPGEVGSQPQWIAEAAPLDWVRVWDHLASVSEPSPNPWAVDRATAACGERADGVRGNLVWRAGTDGDDRRCIYIAGEAAQYQAPAQALGDWALAGELYQPWPMRTLLFVGLSEDRSRATDVRVEFAPFAFAPGDLGSGAEAIGPVLDSVVAYRVAMLLDTGEPLLLTVNAVNGAGNQAATDQLASRGLVGISLSASARYQLGEDANVDALARAIARASSVRVELRDAQGRVIVSDSFSPSILSQAVALSGQ